MLGASGYFVLGFLTAYFFIPRKSIPSPSAKQIPLKTKILSETTSRNENTPSARLLAAFSKIYQDHKKKEHDNEINSLLKENVPQEIIYRVPKELLSFFKDAINVSAIQKHSFSAYYAIQFITKFKAASDDEIVFKWLANLHGIDITNDDK